MCNLFFSFLQRCKVLSHLAFMCVKEGRPCPLYVVGCTKVHSFAEADPADHLKLLLDSRVSGACGVSQHLFYFYSALVLLGCNQSSFQFMYEFIYMYLLRVLKVLCLNFHFILIRCARGILLKFFFLLIYLTCFVFPKNVFG